MPEEDDEEEEGKAKDAGSKQEGLRRVYAWDTNVQSGNGGPAHEPLWRLNEHLVGHDVVQLRGSSFFNGGATARAKPCPEPDPSPDRPSLPTSAAQWLWTRRVGCSPGARPTRSTALSLLSPDGPKR